MVGFDSDLIGDAKVEVAVTVSDGRELSHTFEPPRAGSLMLPEAIAAAAFLHGFDV
jgi:hypothetical protein